MAILKGQEALRGAYGNFRDAGATFPDAAVLDNIKTALTIGICMRIPAATTVSNGDVAVFRSNGTDSWGITFNSNTPRLFVDHGSAAVIAPAGAVYTDDTWFTFIGTFDRDAGTSTDAQANAFVDGVLQSASTSGTAMGGSDTLQDMATPVGVAYNAQTEGGRIECDIRSIVVANAAISVAQAGALHKMLQGRDHSDIRALFAPGDNVVFQWHPNLYPGGRYGVIGTLADHGNEDRITGATGTSIPDDATDVSILEYNEPIF